MSNRGTNNPLASTYYPTAHVLYQSGCVRETDVRWSISQTQQHARNRSCGDCWATSISVMAQRARARGRAQDLPTFRGSRKQRDWAEVLRNKGLLQFIAYKGGPSQRDGKDLLLIGKVLAWASAQADVEWWIDRRHDIDEGSFAQAATLEREAREENRTASSC